MAEKIGTSLGWLPLARLEQLGQEYLVKLLLCWTPALFQSRSLLQQVLPQPQPSS